MKTQLITGGAGFTGSSLVRYWLSNLPSTASCRATSPTAPRWTASSRPKALIYAKLVEAYLLIFAARRLSN